MTTDRRLLTVDDVIGRLTVSLDWWHHNKKRLMETFGFPTPVAGIRHHWDPVAINAWLDNQLPAYALRAAEGPPSEALAKGAALEVVIDYDAVLAARARGQAKRAD